MQSEVRGDGGGTSGSDDNTLRKVSSERLEESAHSFRLESSVESEWMLDYSSLSKCRLSTKVRFEAT